MTRVEAFIESEESILDPATYGEVVPEDGEMAFWLEFHFLLWTHFVVDEVWS